MHLKLRSYGLSALATALSTTAGLFLGLILVAGRASLTTASVLLASSMRMAWLFRFIDRVYLIVFGLSWLMAWLWIDGYVRAGLPKGELWPRFLKVIAVELIALFFALILAALKADQQVNWALTAAAAAALVGGIALLAALRKPWGAPHSH